jgi:hypothetical protein
LFISGEIVSISAAPETVPPLKLLAVVQGQWGERIADNLARHSPPGWSVNRWSAPRALPLMLDDPAELLPPHLPAADVVLALGDTPAAAQLIPDVVRRSGARAVIAPIDRNESLPPGLVTQLRAWLADLGATAVFPKPFCTLTESSYNQPPIRVEYHDPLIAAFARHFGRPELSLTINEDRQVAAAAVTRDSACGCARYVAEQLIGVTVDEAEAEAGMLHHHYPCLAGMTQDADYGDTLMHVSGHLMRAAVRAQVQGALSPTAYFRPAGHVEPDSPPAASE